MPNHQWEKISSSNDDEKYANELQKYYLLWNYQKRKFKQIKTNQPTFSSLWFNVAATADTDWESPRVCTLHLVLWLKDLVCVRLQRKSMDAVFLHRQKTFSSNILTNDWDDIILSNNFIPKGIILAPYAPKMISFRYPCLFLNWSLRNTNNLLVLILGEGIEIKQSLLDFLLS